MNAEARKGLLSARAKYHQSAGKTNFAPYSGKCTSCSADLVDLYGDTFPTADITGCPKCHRSYCD